MVSRGELLTLISGRLPTGSGEAAITPSMAALAGAGEGGTIAMRGLGDTTVVGVVEDPANLRATTVLVDPASITHLAGLGNLSWLIGLPAGASPAQLPASIDITDGGATGAGTSPEFIGTTRSVAGQASESSAGTIFVLGGLALVEAALVASAAFAVSIRRRQRELGLLGAVGGEPSHLAVSVLSEALLLGLIGAVAGVLSGVVAAWLSAPWLDQLTDRRNPPLAITPAWLLAAGAIGLAAALLAAAIPAWTAARVPILAALSGRRPPTAPARRTLRLGIATIAMAFAITLAGSGSALGGINTSLLLLGAVLGVLGFGACSPWLLERLDGVATRLPLASRLALRDTARSRSRNGPIVTALLAAFGATVAVAALLSSQDAVAAANYQPALRTDQLLVAGPGANASGPRVAQELGAAGYGPLVPTDDVNGDGEYLTAPGWEGSGSLVVGDERLLQALGGESALDSFRNGDAILFSTEQKDFGTATIHRLSGDQAIGTLPTRTIVWPVAYAALPTALVSTQTATRLGWTVGVSTSYLVRLPHAVTGQDIDHASQFAKATPNTAVNWETGPHHPGELFRMLLVIASLVFALSVTGVAVALGEAEARPDQRTLLALGADPGVRRRITAARAGVIAAIAGILAVPAGLLPVWGLLASRHDQLVVPVPEVLVALLVLPLSAILGAALLSRPIPVWSAYRNQGS